jgi:anthranilate/para-aminobenzoate synthase component II
LVVKRETFPAVLEITATCEPELVMGLKHRTHPTYGMQFHPESIFTNAGKDLLRNFLKVGQKT